MTQELEKYQEQVFEDIKHIDEYGNEYWEARELMVALEYTKWDHFKNVIDKAIISCEQSKVVINDHFSLKGKTIHMPKGAKKVIVDYKYDEVTEINQYGYAGIKQDGKWGSIDEKGNIIQEPTYDLDELDEINFIGKYYKVVYDYRSIYYTDNVNEVEE